MLEQTVKMSVLIDSRLDAKQVEAYGVPVKPFAVGLFSTYDAASTYSNILF